MDNSNSVIETIEAAKNYEPRAAANNKPKSARHSSRSLTDKIGGKLKEMVREEGNYTMGCTKLFHTRTRFTLLILVLFCLASIWSNILSFNFALICIDDQRQHPNGVEEIVDTTNSSTADIVEPLLDDENSTQVESSSDHLYSARQRLYLTSAVAAAALITNFPIVAFVNQYGIRVIFTLLGILSGVTTCFFPLAISAGFYYVLAARVFQGIAFAANFPVIGAFTSKWTYYKQNGLFVSCLVAYVQFSPAITMPVSGALCSTAWGWPSLFFAHGSITIALFIAFALFYRNSPSKHPCVNEIELRKIATGKSELAKDLLKNIPYSDILKTASVWAVWIAAIGNFVCVNMMFLFSPNYLHAVLKFPVRHTGMSASLAPLAQFSIKLLAGFTSDKIRCLSETNKLRVYNSIAFFGSAFFLVVLAFFPTEYTTICVGILGMSAGLLGFTTGGFFKAGPLVSKHYSHFVTGNVSLGITITMLLVPVMVTGLAPHNTAEEWRWVFVCTAAVLVLSNLLFVIMASAKPAHWTTDEFSRCASSAFSHNRIHPATLSVQHAAKDMA